MNLIERNIWALNGIIPGWVSLKEKPPEYYSGGLKEFLFG